MTVSTSSATMPSRPVAKSTPIANARMNTGTDIATASAMSATMNPSSIASRFTGDSARRSK